VSDVKVDPVRAGVRACRIGKPLEEPPNARPVQKTYMRGTPSGGNELSRNRVFENGDNIAMIGD
jgi:hypothetical protein